MKQQNDRFLVWALALSLALHTIVVFAIRHVQPVEAKDEAQPTRATIEIRVPPPTPTPTPLRVKQRTVARVKPQAPAHVQAPQAHTQTPDGTSGDPTVQASGSETPVVDGSPATEGPPAMPSAEPKPACSTPDVPAKTVDVVDPELPDGALSAEARAEIRVTLSATGAVTDTQIYLSAGQLSLDQAALRAARASTYRPEIRNCVAIGGSYLFTVEFAQ